MGGGVGAAEDVEGAVGALEHHGQARAPDHVLDRLAVSVVDAAQQQDHAGVAQQLGDDLVGAGVIDATHVGEVDHGHPRLDAGDGPLDLLAHGAPRRSRDQVAVDTRHLALQHLMDVDALYHGVADPCSGMMINTWAPGNGGRPSRIGTSSSHFGKMAMRAVPLRIEILPSQRER